jgi:hypothetical protein
MVVVPEVCYCGLITSVIRYRRDTSGQKPRNIPDRMAKQGNFGKTAPSGFQPSGELEAVKWERETTHYGKS